MIETSQQLSFADRLELRLATGRIIDGLWIGTIECDAETILQRVEAALTLIRHHDFSRYQKLRRDVSRIWVRLLPGARANFNASARACQLDSRYVRDQGVSVSDLATTLVHEAAQAVSVKWWKSSVASASGVM
jgi:hypothetical protein